jgi:hypothetical protein
MFKQLKRYYTAVLQFFPIQLILVQLKKGHLLLVFWFLLYALITGGIARKYGGAYLFLSPEYLDDVNPLSYFLVGLCFGFFTMAFHISSYIHYSFRFPFLATLARPLFKFSLNNSLVPAIVILVYIKEVIQFQIALDNLDWLGILFIAASLVIGIIVAIALIFTYFMNTNKSLVEEKLTEIRPLRLLVKERTDLDTLMPDDLNKVKTYLNGFWHINLVRRTSHYDQAFMLKTLQQHHRNAAVYAVVVFVLLLLLSLFKESGTVMLPAAGSILILFALYLMITGALVSRFKGWTTTVIIIGFLIVNALSGEGRLRGVHPAYGINYDTTQAEYSYDRLQQITSPEIIEEDKLVMLEILEKWKAKNMGADSSLPKIIFINTSGGGLRSALWTFNVMQTAEELSGGAFMSQTHFISGSSGGLLGTSFFRELYLQKSPHLFSDSLGRHISKDILNPVVFNLIVSDLFINFDHWKDGDRSYRKDRGFAFEYKFSENTGGILDKRMRDYSLAERNAEIPMTLISPTLINEGRRLLISPLPISYLSVFQTAPKDREPQHYDGIEFSRMFADQDAGNLRFLTALRMSATFPYITPLVKLPSTPPIQLMDSGVRDNTGYEISLRFLHFFKDWIQENTSGVIFLQINSDRVQNMPIEQNEQFSQLESALQPVSGAYESFMNMQLFTQAQLRQITADWFKKPVDFVDFSLLQESQTDLSLSWHLTSKEKDQINLSLHKPVHEKSFKELIKLLNTKN